MLQLINRFYRWPFAGLAGMSVLSVFVFAWLYPTHFLIADETAYFEQAKTWAAGRLSTCVNATPCAETCQPRLPGDYPAGTALLGAVWIKLGGIKAIFWSSLVCWLAGAWAIGACLNNAGKPVFWAFYPWLFLPGLVMTRTVMSDVPSFCVTAGFLWLYTMPTPRRSRAFMAGVLGGLGLLFRETNVILIFPFLLGAILRRTPQSAYLWMGCTAGIAFRLLVAWWCFGNPLFARDPGLGFSLNALPQNLAWYLLALTLLAPGGLWLLLRSTWVFRTEAVVSLALFLTVYGAYEYDAFAKSGYKGLVLQGRFLLPLLPAITLAAAHGQTAVHRKIALLRPILMSTAIVFFGLVHWWGWRYNRSQQAVTSALMQYPVSRQISFTPDETRKFLNDLTGSPNWYSADRITRQQIQCDTVWYAQIISRTESADRVYKTSLALHNLQRFWKDSLPGPCLDIAATAGVRLRVWKLTPEITNKTNDRY